MSIRSAPKSGKKPRRIKVRRRLRPTRPLLFGLAGVTVAGGIAFGLRDTSALLAPSVPWLALVVAFYITDWLAVRLRFGREERTVSMVAAPLVVGLLAVAPVFVIVAQAMAAAFFSVTARSALDERVHFFGTRVAQTAIAIVVFGFAAPTMQLLGPVGWLAAISAALAGLAFGHVMDSVAGVAAGVKSDRDSLETFGFGAVVTSLNAALGMVTANALFASPASAVFAFIPGIVLLSVYRWYASSRQERTRLIALYEATRALHESPQVEKSLIAAAAHARVMFEAEFCEIVLLVGAEPAAYRTIVGPAGHESVMEPTDLERWRLVWDRAAAEGEPFIASKLGSLASSANERRLPISSAMVAPVHAGGNQAGIIVVANPEAPAGTFEDVDLGLLATLASQVAVAVENGRLEDSLAQLTELKEELRHQALHDALTGLANRTLFGEQVSHAMARTRRTGTHVSVLFLDLDDFKTVNDSLGHAAGDELLQTVSNRLREQCRPEDTIARLGGDEFGVLLEDIGGPQDAITVAGRILEALNVEFSIAGREVAGRASIGIAFGSHGDSASQVLRDADAAMYSAKRSGKGDFRLFEDGMHQEVVRQLELKVELDTAIQRGELRLVYQPLVDLTSGVLNGFEALVRWDHSRKGVLGPGEFVAFAEEVGLIHDLGHWVLREALGQLKVWQDQLQPAANEFKVTVNVSAKQLESPSFVVDVARVIGELDVDPSLVVLEITETAVMRTAPDVLDSLRSLGLRIAIDDFGTGYSSLGSLHKLPVDVLKIDRLFVEAMDDDTERSPFMSTIVGLAQALGLETVVEGIETADQLARVRDHGCETGQGFYFARPLKLKKANALIERQLVNGAAFDLDALASGKSKRRLRAVG